jgi:hypothetical protein
MPGRLWELQLNCSPGIESSLVYARNSAPAGESWVGTTVPGVIRSAAIGRSLSVDTRTVSTPRSGVLRTKGQ